MESESEVVRRAPYGDNPEVGDRARRTYDRILQASVRVFERHGFQDARMNDIARAARTARATVYQYFESKHDILLALSTRFGTDIATLVETLEPLDTSTESRERFRVWLDGLVELTIRYAPVIDVWADPAATSGDLQETGDRILADFGRQLGDHLGGATTDLDASVVAVALYATVEALVGRHLSGDLTHPLPVVLDELALIVHVSLFPGTRVPARGNDT